MRSSPTLNMSNCRCTVFAAVRTYAIWDKDRRIFAGVVVPGLGYPLGYIVSEDFKLVNNTLNLGTYSTTAHRQRISPHPLHL